MFKMYYSTVLPLLMPMVNNDMILVVMMLGISKLKLNTELSQVSRSYPTYICSKLIHLLGGYRSGKANPIPTKLKLADIEPELSLATVHNIKSISAAHLVNLTHKS